MARSVARRIEDHERGRPLTRGCAGLHDESDPLRGRLARGGGEPGDILQRRSKPWRTALPNPTTCPPWGTL